MTGSDNVMYPMLGVGGFFAAFWAGFVIAYEVGAPCLMMPVVGLLTGVAASAFVAGLESSARGERVDRGTESTAVDGAGSRAIPSRLRYSA